MNRLYMTGYSNKERNEGISEIEKIVSRHGFIIDFKMFSDISLSILIEAEEQKVDKLYHDLKSCMKMNDFEHSVVANDNECEILLNVTFSKGTGNLKIEVPAIPG